MIYRSTNGQRVDSEEPNRTKWASAVIRITPLRIQGFGQACTSAQAGDTGSEKENACEASHYQGERRLGWAPCPSSISVQRGLLYAPGGSRGSEDLGKEPSVGACLVLGIGQSSPFTPPWPSRPPSPQLLLSRTLSKGPGAIPAGRVPVSSKEALPTLYTAKIEVSLTLGLGNLGPEALPAHLALKSKVLAEVGPGESVQVLQTEKQEEIWEGPVREREQTQGAGLGLGRPGDEPLRTSLPLTLRFHRS